MALLLLLSTVSFTVEKHYCGDVLIDVAVFSKVERCGMESSEIEQAAVSKKSCCKDQLDIVEGQDQLKIKSIDDLDLEQQKFLIAYAFAFEKLYENLPKLFIPHQYYSPPELIADIQLLDEVFLI